jgi:hypothetical protein
LVDAVTVESIFNDGVSDLPDLSHLSHATKDALIRALWAQVQSLTARVEALEARLAAPANARQIQPGVFDFFSQQFTNFGFHLHCPLIRV